MKIIYVISLAINVILVIAVVLLAYAFYPDDLDASAKFGDAVGGILGTVVSAITVIFILLTYQAQRKTIKMQADEIAEQRSLTLQNNYLVTLREIERQFDSIKYINQVFNRQRGRYEDDKIFYGKEILHEYTSLDEERVQNFYKRIHPYDDRFIRDLLEISDNLRDILAIVELQKDRLLEAHFTMVENKIASIMREYWIRMAPIFSTIGIHIQGQADTPAIDASFRNINIVMNWISRYQSTVLEFIQLGYLENSDGNNEGPDLFQNERIDRDLYNSIVFNLEYRVPSRDS